MKPYKVQLVQQLKPIDHPNRLLFANWVADRLAEDGEFYRKIIFSDEAHFHLGHRKSAYRRREANAPTTCHCLVRILVSRHYWSIFFFENEEGATVTVNGERYRQMLSDWFFEEIEAEDLDDIWFQQDGATCHSAHATIDLLRPMYVRKSNNQQKWRCELAAKKL
ncbi:hypothetical protein ACLKA6_010198 [Drosophila palustris]